MRDHPNVRQPLKGHSLFIKIDWLETFRWLTSDSSSQLDVYTESEIQILNDSEWFWTNFQTHCETHQVQLIWLKFNEGS